jgi:hypothetical protein
MFLSVLKNVSTIADSVDSCSKEYEIDYLMIYASRGLHPDKEQLPMTEVIKYETRYRLR